MRFAPLVAVLLFFSSPSLAAAQTGAEVDYRVVVEEAVAEFNAGRFTEARVLFLQAHALSPNARTLLGIGMSSFELRDYVEACRALYAALLETERALGDTQRAEADAILVRARRFVGTYRLELSPPSTHVTVDGEELVTLGDGRVVLGLGEHHVSGSADHYDASEVVVRVAGGEDTTLTLRLALAHEELAVVETRDVGDVVTPPVVVDEPRRDAPDLVPAVVVTAAGGALLASALGVGLGSWWTREAELGSCTSPPAGLVCDNEGTLRSERDGAAGATLALTVVGVAALATGLAMFVTSSSGEPAVACLPTGPGVVCAGRF